LLKPDALRTILKEEGFLALYRGIGPGLLLVCNSCLSAACRGYATFLCKTTTILITARFWSAVAFCV